MKKNFHNFVFHIVKKIISYIIKFSTSFIFQVFIILETTVFIYIRHLKMLNYVYIYDVYTCIGTVYTIESIHNMNNNNNQYYYLNLA